MTRLPRTRWRLCHLNSIPGSAGGEGMPILVLGMVNGLVWYLPPEGCWISWWYSASLAFIPVAIGDFTLDCNVCFALSESTQAATAGQWNGPARWRDGPV